MTISKDLFLSILALDSHNRGHDAGIGDGGANDLDGLGEAGSVGAATITSPPAPGRDGPDDEQA